MKRKIGRLCMVLGAVLILCAAGLLGYNRWDAVRAEKASQEVLGELEQTMQKDHHGAPAGKRDCSPAADAGPSTGDDHRGGGRA